MVVGSKYSTEISNEEYDTIVIGSGAGGLTAAVLLAELGQKVIVFEKHYMAGGFTHTYRRKGYEFDVGFHYAGDVHRENSQLRNLFHHVSGGKLEWKEVGPVYDRIVFPDRTYDFVAGEKNFISELSRHFPDEHKRIKKFVKRMKKVSGSFPRFMVPNFLPAFIDSFCGDKIRGKFQDFAQTTTREALEEHFSNEDLRAILAGQCGDYGLPPSQSSFGVHSIIACHYMDGASYPIGGGSTVARTMVEKLERHGGNLVVRTGVDEILIEDDEAKGVRLENGDVVRAKRVVSNAGYMNTFQRLVKNTNVREDYSRILPKLNRSTSHMCLYLGFKKSDEELGLGTANYWVYPSYEHDKNFDAYSEEPFSNPPPITYISFPSAKDPSFSERFPGKSTVQVIGMVKYDWFKDWDESESRKRGEEYESLKERLAQPHLDILYKHFPQLEGELDFIEISSPLSTRDYSHTGEGEIYGIACTPERFTEEAWGYLKPDTRVENLYLAGQDTTMVGVPSAVVSGYTVASMISGKNLLIKYGRKPVA